MNRLREQMTRLRDDGKTALVIYITQGDPTPDVSADIVVAAADAGADVIELGVPFSDPNADGVVIQQAMERALAAGGGLESSLETVRSIRARGCQVPIVLFGYYNPIFVYGLDKFAADAAEAGVDATLIVDLPIDELGELSAPLAAKGLDVVPLIAPTSGADRIEWVREFTPPFVYYISMTGVTGGAFERAGDLSERVGEVRTASGAPVAVGFGIKTPDDAKRVAGYADGVVVGSAVVKTIEAAGSANAAASVGDYVASLRQAMG